MITDTNILIPEMPCYVFRFAQREDLPAIRQMLICAAAANRTGYVDTLEDMNNQFNDPWSDPEKDFLLALTADGRVAAMGRIFVNPIPRRERYANLWGEIHPEHRDLGLDEHILTWMEGRARQRLLEFPADLPRSLRTTSLDYLSERIAGFCINFVREEDNRREGIAEGQTAELGTRQPWRRRGIASALLCESMRAFKAAGLDFAALGVDVESPTGALNLYERLGFTRVKCWFTFSKSVE